MPKLTLSADTATIRRAKALAAEEGTSVSAMFERFIVLLDLRRQQPGEVVGPLTRSASGLIDLGGRDEHDVLADALLDRHGLA